ncbi:ASKHA domain-containing protein [Zhenpiania hominis]|uniref:ASKHA domain-containing protein n=1 Tax=Zhenpiania hominis TaxID=2763644 RepID=UPI0039F529A3
MFKCTGVCSTCGRCKGAAMMSGANDRKTRMLAYPADFKPETGGEGLGIAFDIGTTTVVGMLWDLKKGEQIATCAKTNPQNEFGMDVISRITFCGKEGENLELLRNKITGCLNEIIAETCEKAGAQKTEIVRATVCGNTTMSHLFAGYPPMTLALAPFAPAYTGTLKMSGKEALLDIREDGTVVVLPNIAGHVGGDITAGIVASRVLDQKGLSVFIDIGTNGEIMLTDGSTSYACSTAAGPAFEGSAILHGMRAATGAIERVRIEDGEVFFKTIGECEPQGICGSGLIDAIAQMIENKLISKSGRLICAEDVDKKHLNEKLKEHLIEEGGERRFVLISKESGEDIVITQNDIREVQLAKGAIAAGISLMLQEMGKNVEDIDRVIVAGAFGNYIDKESAVTIGVLPALAGEKILSAGNTAGAGVSMALASEKELELAERIPQLVKHVDLAARENFQETYLGAMAFR